MVPPPGLGWGHHSCAWPWLKCGACPDRWCRGPRIVPLTIRVVRQRATPAFAVDTVPVSEPPSRRIRQTVMNVTTRVRQCWSFPQHWSVELDWTPDVEVTPYEADCYSSDDLALWHGGSWEYVVLTVWVLDVYGSGLASDSLAGVEFGQLSGVFADPLATGRLSAGPRRWGAESGSSESCGVGRPCGHCACCCREHDRRGSVTARQVLGARHGALTPSWTRFLSGRTEHPRAATRETSGRSRSCPDPESGSTREQGPL